LLSSFSSPLFFFAHCTLTIVNCIDIMTTLQFLLKTIINTSLALLVFSLPKATAPPTIAAKVLKNNPPSKNDTARLTNGALYIIVSDVATKSAAAPRAEVAATAATPEMASAERSTRTDEVRPGVNSHAEAAASRDVVVVVVASRRSDGRRRRGRLEAVRAEDDGGGGAR
jgi:hypothetical protein